MDTTRTESVLEREGCPLHYWVNGPAGKPLAVENLLMHGEGNKMGDIAKIAPLWAAREPDCRYVVIPDARHFAVLDNPEFFNRVLLEFLEKVTE